MEMSEADWHDLSPLSSLVQEEVHVWRVPLDVPPATLPSLQAILTAEERNRAERYYFEQHRCRYIAAHGFLRHILGHYAQIPPAQVTLKINAFGKPALVAAIKENRLRFNLSHSEGWAVIALAVGREVGVDLEWMRHDVNVEEVASHFFSTTEIQALRAASDTDKTALFFRFWTQKEAYLKGRGEGLAGGLDHFYCVPVHPVNSMLWTVQRENGVALHWTGRTLYPVEGFVGAVAVPTGDWRLRCGEWTL